MAQDECVLDLAGASQFDDLNAVSIYYEAVAGCGSVSGDSAAFSSSRKAAIVCAL
jgi:hypothetical protein